MKETSHKDSILYDPIYMKYPEQANMWRQKVDQWLLRVGDWEWEMGSVCFQCNKDVLEQIMVLKKIIVVTQL